MLRLVFGVAFWMAALCAWAQQRVELHGLVSDGQGEALPFVNVYVEGTTYGTTANEEGVYGLELDGGQVYRIVFQYIGYQPHIETVRTIDGRDIVLDVRLEQQDLELSEVVVRADAEDPAYRIIREAQRMRKTYREQLHSFDCNVYIKGNQRLLSAPKKILGIEVGDMNGGLDSTGKGIVYLAESVSHLYYEEPNKYREEMISSKVSGDDNGFSFARAQGMNFNFYDNQLDFIRPMISPIAEGAMQYYRYRMVGKYYDDKKRLINKIAVLPKNEVGPLFGGIVYIQEDAWNLTAVDLFMTGKAAEFAALDTLFIRQSLVPLEEDGIWMPISQTLDFGANMLGFSLKGSFVGVYSNYRINTDYSKRFFKQEVFKVTEEATKREAVYWDTIRPIPLTGEEVADYVRKDSIRRIRNSEPYLDSMSKVGNRFKLGNLFGGYTYSDRKRNNIYSINMPLAGVQYNTVQGFNAALDLAFRHGKDKDYTAYSLVKGTVQYGFSDKQLMGKLLFSRQFNSIRYTKVTLEGGRVLQQYNDKIPINPFRNSLTSLIFESNWMKQYERRFTEVTFQHNITNGLTLKTALSYNDRTPVTNHADFTFIDYPKKAFTPELTSSPSQAIISKTTLRLRFNQTYTTYPNRRILHASNLPELYLHYTHGIYTDGSDIWFNNTTLQLKDNLPIGTAGTSSFNILAGMHHFSTDSTQQYLYDLYHFNGNQAYLTYNDRYLETFQLLPYYTYSTTGKYLEAHYEHNFGSFLFRKIPLIKKLGLHNQIGAHYLTTPTDQYFEWNAGLSNIGFKLFRILRVDYHMGITNWNTIKDGATFSLQLGIGG